MRTTSKGRAGTPGTEPQAAQPRQRAAAFPCFPHGRTPHSQTPNRQRLRAAFLHCLLLLCFLPIAAAAQNDVQVATLVKPPYSPYLSDYVGFDNKIVITLTNTTNSPQSVRLVGSVKGNTGVTVTIPNSFIPASPIALAPKGVKVLMGSQLKEYLNPDVLQFSGISKQEVVQGNGLPEGSYSICIQALDFNTGVAKSQAAPSGCANFTITHYEPPTLQQPACNSSVVPKNPQSQLFSWTAPAGAPAFKMEYVLKIVEVIPANTNPNQAMNATPDPPFFQKVVQGTSYLYGPGDPELQNGKKYAVRVTARNKGESKELNFKNNGHSVVCAFTYGQLQAENQPEDQESNDQPNEDQPNDQPNNVDENYAPPCAMLNCAPQPLAPATPNNKVYQVGDEIQIGYFTLKLTSLSSPNAGSLSGEGVIDAPIFRVKLKTTFTGLKVNPDNKVYSGKAIGSYDPGAQVDEAMKNFTNNLGNIAAQKVKAVSDFVKSNQKYIENFVNVDAQGLPFGWKKMVNSNIQLVNVASVEFAPDGARMNAFMEVPIPEAQNKILAFGQKNICFHPTGLSVDGLQKLTMLGQDFTFPWGDKITLTLKAANGNNGTFVKWDCEGYKGMQADGYFTIKSQLIEKANGGGDVKASFLFSNVGAWGDLLGEVDMDSFVVKGAKGLTFSFSKVVLDFSDARNAEGMVFPANYNGGKGNDWRGFYFKEIKARLPKFLKNNGKQVELSIANTFINKTGFTGTAAIQPVFDIGKGNIGGWGFSMDKFELAFLNNSLTKGEFLGKIKVPIAETGIGYKCLISSQNLAFQVTTLDTIDVAMWGAKLSLLQGSNITVTAVNDDVTVKAVMTGSLTLDKKFVELKAVSVKIPGVEFQNLTIQNKPPFITATLFKFASPQKWFAGFPVSINPQDGIQLKTQGDQVGLRLSFHIGLDGNNQSAISGGTAFTIWGKKTEVQGKQSWVPAMPTLEEISINADVAAVHMDGKINLYNGDPTFGEGFRGAINVEFKPLLKLSATVQFGSTAYQSNSSYRYWYVDAMAVMGTGIPVFPGFGIYGFGGGAYYHMKPEAAVPTAATLEGTPDKAKNFDQNSAGKTSSGVVYKPDPNIAFGFKATLVMGTMPKPNAFNGDVTIEASFFNGGGLNEISLSGNGYFFTPPNPKSRPAKEAAMVYAGVSFKYSNAKKTFDGLLELAINLKAGNKSLISGGGQAAMHFSKDKWFIKIGEPSNRIKLKVLNLLEVNSYMMVGKNSLPGMPPLPTSPINFQQKLPSFNSQNPRDPSTETGSGFAFGQQISVNTGKLKFLIFYAQIAIDFGYDISILNYDQECEYSNGKMGFNGWYANGQVYAGLEASVGIDINLWFLKAQLEILNVGVYAALKAGLPNPTWLQGEVSGHYSLLNGLLSGQCNFKFKYGNKCDMNQGDPFGGVKVISEVNPSGSDANVFSYPEAVYNLPLGKAMTIQTPDPNDEDEVITTTFRFGLRSFKVVNTKNGSEVSGQTSLHNNGLTTLFSPDEMFNEKTKYEATVKVYGEKKVNGQWKIIGKKNNPDQEHNEVEEQTFTTGDAPETFVNSNIIASRPGRMHRYFLKGETNDGVIQFNQYPSNIPNAKPKENDKKYIFRARFQEVGGGSQVVGETALQWDAAGKRVNFDLPNTLKNEKIYIIQFIRKKVEKGGGGSESGAGQVSSSTEEKSLGQGQKINVRRNRLQSIRLGDDEFLIYQLAFRTSMFSTLESKIKDYVMLGPPLNATRHGGNFNNTLYQKYEGKEAMDWYDLHQIQYNQASVTKYIEPPVTVQAVDRGKVGNSYYWTSLHDHYLDLISGKLKDRIKYDWNNQIDNKSVRSYPATGAYQPGSRLTNGTNVTSQPFPVNAAAIYYDGNGNSSKLTNEEINASYWKGLPPENNGGGPNGFGSIAVKANNNGPNAGLNLQAPKPLNYLVVCYDAATVMQIDRGKVVEALMNKFGPILSGMPEYATFAKYNNPTNWYYDDNGPNPNLDSMNLKKGTDVKVVITYGYTNKKNLEDTISPP